MPYYYPGDSQGRCYTQRTTLQSMEAKRDLMRLWADWLRQQPDMPTAIARLQERADRIDQRIKEMRR